MLSRVTIQNFKSIGEPGVDLELKPLTFLVGPNGGGKSSILEAIGVAIQQSPSGKLTKFPEWADVIHRPGGSGTRLDIYFNTAKGSPVASLGSRVIISQGGNSHDYLQGLDHVTSSKNAVGSIERLMEDTNSNTFLISSTRGNVRYRVGAGDDPGWTGTQGEHLLLLLARIYGRRQYDGIARTIARWASSFGIDGLKAGLWEGGSVGADYLDSELDVPINLALSSSGARQILTIIAQLFWSPEGSLLMIEEPEISLHPQAQVDAMEMFAEAIKEDKQIIATTHGLFMIQAIGYAIQKGWLERDQVAVYHVEKKKDTGTVAKRLPLNKRGYIKGWIPSFTRVERKLLNEWVKGLPEA